MAVQKENTESAIGKALAIINAFSYANPVLGVSELARRLEMPKSTVHRVLSVLVDEGYVERTRDDRYRLSLRLYEIGQQVVSSYELRQVGHVPLERLRNETGETTHLAVLAGADVVYLDRFESPHMIRMLAREGRRRSAHATSSGKVLLAYGSKGDLAATVDGGLARLGPRTITTRTQLLQVLADVRKHGYAVSSDESAPGVVSVAAPVFDGEGACVAAVSVAGPLIRMPPESHQRLARMVVKTAAEISKGLATGRGRL